MADEVAAHGGLSHLAFFYRDQAEYLAHIQAFANDGLANAEPVFVAVPGDKARLVRGELGGEPGQVSYGDMAELGRNPGRLIPAVRAFAEAHRGRRVRYVSEPVWPGRPAAEACEATRHEALINLAFSRSPVSIMCPYDAAGLTPAALSEARFTHPAVLQNGQPQASADFAGPGLLPPDRDRPLPAPPGFAQALGYSADLRPVRRLVAGDADQACRRPNGSAIWSSRSARSPRTRCATPPGTACSGSGTPNRRSCARCRTTAGSPTRWQASNDGLPTSRATGYGWSTRCAIWSRCAPGRPAPRSACT